MWNEIPCTIFRGGTSKGLFFLKSDMPQDEALWPDLLLAVMGSPDHLQIDGLGGATATTSKVAIVSPASSPEWDVDYLFAQVSVDKPVVSYKGNCGNMLSAVGPFAIEAGLVTATDPVTTVRIFNVNTEKVIEARIPTSGGRVSYEGDQAIAGVPGTSASIRMAFKDPAGSVTGALLPTGNVLDRIDVPDFGPIDVSFVDSSNPVAFIRAADVGLTGRELPPDIDGNPAMLERLERIRGTFAVRLGFITDRNDSRTLSPTVPKLNMISAPQSYRSASGKEIDADEMDILCRMMSMQKTHKNYALTSAMCTASAAVIPGTIVQELVRPGFDSDKLRIGHPGGIMQAGVDFEVAPDGQILVKRAIGYRTARMLMRGTAFYRSADR